MDALLLFTALFSVPSYTTATADFLLNPKSRTITLGSTAEFSCRINSTSLYWSTNATTPLEYTVTERGGVSISILSIPAIRDNNNTKVECVTATASNEELYSSPAYLQIQGLLDAPSNIKISPLPTTIGIAWDPPFTLNIADTEDDLWYTIEIMNVTNGSNLTTTVIPCTTCPVYEPRYNFTIDSPDPCSRFTFRITAINGAGIGQTSETVYGYFLGAPQSILATDIEAITILHPLGVLELKIMFPITNFCLGKVPNRFKLYFEGHDGNQYVYDHESVQEPDEDGLMSITFFVHNSSLPFQQTYRVILEAQNQAGQATNSSKSFDLFAYPSTNFDEAEVKVSENGSLCITCVYTPGPEVLGCVVLVQFQNASLSRNISRQYMAGFAHGCFTIHNEESNYTVAVYTWESESYIGDYPVYVAQVSTVTASFTSPVTPSTSVPDEFPSMGAKCASSCIIGVATVSSVIVACVIITLSFAIRRHYHRRDSTSSKTHEDVMEISLKRNISYEQHQLSCRNPLQPTELEPCPAYGVVVDRQVANYHT